MILYNDTETFSSINLKTHGATAYSESPDAEVMLWAYAIDDGGIRVGGMLPDQEGLLGGRPTRKPASEPTP